MFLNKLGIIQIKVVLLQSKQKQKRMKSIEEKAKAYDELLVKLQEAKVDNNICDERYCCVIDDIVPELKESEDEKKELKKIENEIEIPFDAKDSELQEVTYYIPEGFHAEIEGNNIIIKKGEQNTAEWSEEDEKRLQSCLNILQAKGLMGGY